MSLILSGCTVFDGHSAELREGQAIFIENGLVKEVAADRECKSSVERIDVGGRFVMPGLIDAHFHAYGVELSIAAIDRIPPILRGLHARRILEATLRRGFTTVRDAGGADMELADAIEAGLIDGPRLFYPGLAVSQTGGHGDFRNPRHHDACLCAYRGAISIVADGPDEMRRVVREQLRKGAHQIKLFVSGGVLSPTDPIWMNQFSDEEIRVAVEEAATRRSYVMAHVHTNDAAIRCVNNGVRSIEHATLLGDDGVRAIVDRGAFVVPTLAIGDAVQDLGPALGLPAVMLDKIKFFADEAYASLERLRRAQAKIGFGTDLLGKVMDRQSREFVLRREVFSPLEILRSATSVNAELLQMSGKLGVIAPDAFADMLVLDGNPLEDIALLARPGSIRMILKDGRIIHDSLR